MCFPHLFHVHETKRNFYQKSTGRWKQHHYITVVKQEVQSPIQRTDVKKNIIQNLDFFYCNALLSITVLKISKINIWHVHLYLCDAVRHMRFSSWTCSRQNCVMLSFQYGPKALRHVSKSSDSMPWRVLKRYQQSILFKVRAKISK